MRTIALALLCGLLLTGCGEDGAAGPASKAARKRRPRAARPRGPATARSANRPVTAPAATRPTATQPAQPVQDPARLDERVKAIAQLEEQGEFTRAWKLALEARGEFSGYPNVGELNQVVARLRQSKRQAAELSGAVKCLDSEIVEAAQIAASELLGGGRIGMVLLRKVLRTGSDQAAAKAASLLAKANDPQAAALLGRRLQAGPREPLRSALLEALRSQAKRIGPNLLRDLYAGVKDAPFADARQVVGVLTAVFREAAGGDAGEFNRLLADPNAHADLKAKVAEALHSTDDALANAAAEASRDLGAMTRGLRGSYYDGTNFEKLLFERIDSRIDIPESKLPYPDGRQTKRSIRWAGQVYVPADGKYTFFIAIDDGGRLWLDGKRVIDAWRTQGVAEYSASLDLKKGFHPLRMDYFQGEGQCEVHLRWAGPGIDKQLLTDKVLASLPRPPTKAKPPDKK